MEHLPESHETKGVKFLPVFSIILILRVTSQQLSRFTLFGISNKYSLIEKIKFSIFGYLIIITVGIVEDDFNDP